VLYVFAKHFNSPGLVSSENALHSPVSGVATPRPRLGRIKPLLARPYPLSDIRQALRDFMNQNFFGKIVLIPNLDSEPNRAELGAD
jgi:NADPH:quinone reductase-like Zn-dependent oxidoreductase